MAGEARLKLGEILTESIIAKLQQYMPGRCQAINQFFGNQDITQIQAPANENYHGGRVADIAVIPSIYVLEGPAKFAAEGGHGLITETEMLIHIADGDQTGPLLAKRLQRQVAAIIESLWDDAPQEALLVQSGPFSGQPSAFRLWPQRTIPGDVFEPDAEHKWKAMYTLVWNCRQVEH
jgi:hypothetical protein